MLAAHNGFHYLIILSYIKLYPGNPIAVICIQSEVAWVLRRDQSSSRSPASRIFSCTGDNSSRKAERGPMDPASLNPATNTISVATCIRYPKSLPHFRNFWKINHPPKGATIYGLIWLVYLDKHIQTSHDPTTRFLPKARRQCTIPPAEPSPHVRSEAGPFWRPGAYKAGQRRKRWRSFCTN